MGSRTDGMEASLRGRRRPSGGADLLLHQEAQHQPPACKRRSRGEEEVKKSRRRRWRRRRRRRTAGAGEENRDPNDLMRNMGTQTPSRDHRRFSQSATGTRTPVKTGFGFISGSEIQFCRPEVRKALVRKTRNQTSVQNLVQDLILTDKTDLQSPETQMDQRRPSQVRPTQVRSRSTAGPLETAGVVSDQSLKSRTSRRRSERGLGLEYCRREGLAPRIRSSSEGRRPETRRRKIHPSVFRGRGQLRLSITPEAGQLIIHIYEARGLLGKSQRSCDSYVEVSVTSDVNRSIMMKTPTVLNNKNPEYNHSLILGISDDLILSRLLVSVFSRCSRLIGCMSFGIDSCVLSLKLVTGWFYLLGEEFGRRKHLRLTSQRNKPIRSRDDGSEGILPTYYADLRRTPDSAPDADLNHITTAAATPNLSNASTTTAGLKDLRNHSLTSSCPHSHDPTNANYSKYISVLYANTTRNSTQQLTVNVVRGKDGFGFTICSDCPVRVQAVDSEGPAHESGLRQGDSILQLNGIPVETWKCVDLAHAIRSCPSQIVLVVWRGLPELRTGCEALLRPLTHHSTSGRKLLPHPTHSKHGCRRGQGLGVRSSLGALGSLWMDKKEEQKEEEEEQETSEFTPTTTTLKGTRVTSSHGDNYIILSPVNSGAQLLQPVYHDRNGTIGHLYQTHPSRGQNLLQDPRPGSTQRPFTGHTSTLPPPLSSSSSTLPSNYGNYQNCTIVQSHLPCSSYGTYVTLAPKTLIFPIFVQPLDLCSPDRTLLMAEEMVLHQADLLPAKVTVLIYSDLMLFTREDEAGRCNVLQSPLYLNTLQLREVSSEPLQIYFLQSSQDCWHYLFSLEAFSLEQKVRVSLCLHDNIQLQMVAMETGHTQELPGLPSDFGLLSLHQSDLLYRPSSAYPSSDPALLCPSPPYSSLCDSLRPPSPSPYCPSSPFCSSSPPPSFSSLSPHTNSSPPPQTHAASSQHQPLPPPSSSTHKSTVWKERGGTGEEEERRRRRHEEEVEERQQGEGESASETSENVGGIGGRGLLFNPHLLNMKGHEEEESDADEEEEEGVEEVASSCRPEVVSVLRRSLSVGSLLQEPRSPRFLSDSTIHRLTHPMTFDLDPGPGPQPPSINTLRKQLTREGGSLHHMLLLLNGTMDAELRNLKLKKKTKSLAADVRSHLPFLRRRKNGTSIHGNSLEKALRNNRPSTEEVLRWGESLEALLTNQYGLAVFRHFLRSEFSEENLDFWLAVERFKRTSPVSKMAARAAKIYDEFISTSAARQVNIDSSVRELTNQSISLGVNRVSFQPAQDQIFGLMETDSYPRFLKSRLYAQLANHGTEMATESAN